MLLFSENACNAAEETPSCATEYNPSNGYYDPNTAPEGSALGYFPITRVSYQGKNYSLISGMADPGKAPEISPGSRIWKMEGLCTTNTQIGTLNAKEVINDLTQERNTLKNKTNEESVASTVSDTQNEQVQTAQEAATISNTPPALKATSKVIGYLRLSDAITLENAASQGYEGLIIDTLSIDKEKIAFQNTHFAAYQISGQDPDASVKIQAAMTKDIQAARGNGGLQWVLATIDESSLAKNLVDLEVIANQLVGFLKSHQLNGIHLAFEQESDAFNSSKLMMFLQKLKTLWPEIVISAQMVPLISSDQIQYAAYGDTTLYQESLVAGMLDCVCLKTYGHPGLALTPDGHMCPQTEKCWDDTLPEFMAAAFQAFKRLTPAKTQIIINQPANEKRAQISSPFQGPKAGEVFQIWAKTFAELSADPQFGGVSADVLFDAENEFQWVKSFKPPVAAPSA